MESGDRIKTLCIDFDGVIHSYSKWEGPLVISDPPVPGALEFIVEMIKYYRINIFSSRSNHTGAIDAMRGWLKIHYKEAGYDDLSFIDEIDFPTHKPPAHLYIDDRAFAFQGGWPSLDYIRNFVPWNRIGENC